ncbi:biofilm regulation protein phosphatase SiaA [Pseudomonas sp. MAP12]|uniref:Biofilm regulation protein phosphatase SiaA n=1 Tax=Geopseudomonas aromaticivorans TaxID=2849492 RepID=A0ABS6MVR9_9GAMM|nr:biofilm regulation protein phosphatase SiaA [Pseudomonas aromaticivorans]MBV2132362.1 biofilm regulation protein phosphatase SiaA [Pseudomonas aromaticivorans]
MAANWGLRSKSVLALLLACVLALIPAVLLGWRAMEDIRQHFGEAYARNFALLHRERILAPVARELALARRFADAQLTRQWLLAEADGGRRTAFFAEAEGYQRDFRDHSWFVIPGNGHYYFNDASQPTSQQPRYVLNPADPQDAWFFASIRGAADYNLNVNIDHKLKVTKVWFNVLVRDGAQVLGLAGTGMDLSTFIDRFIVSREPGVTPMILAADGAIQAHPDPARIAYNSGVAGSAAAAQVFDLLPQPAEREALRAAMRRAEAEPDGVQILRVSLDGQPRLLALSYIAPLRWHLLTAVDLHAAQVLDNRWLWPLLGTLVMLLAALLLGFAYAVERLLLQPLRSLKRSAKAIAAGRYDTDLPPARGDEIGELSAAFASMAAQVHQHTAELEGKVRERTHALEQANREMAAAHKQIDDSIDYASLIQRAILPARQLAAALGEQHFVLWKPRDVVGGDFYVYRDHADGCLLGVVDCAGHGVPGALMTMLAQAAIDHAIGVAGADDPAAILQETDRTVRGMLGEEPLSQALATNMDAGLVWVDRRARRLRFAGARIALFASDGEEVREFKGSRRALADKRQGEYANLDIELPAGWTFYLCTDGFLDQAGGEHGFGFGNRRFGELLRRHARRPLAEQAELFVASLAAYRGERPQRDDITVLSFRFD